ncbi:MAG: ornithine--oxo-acid transaminase [Fimbriimonadales bacterium]|nr:ornithine--oxo-acid transaminase [Fimbriimonadales bacterium]
MAWDDAAWRRIAERGVHAALSGWTDERSIATTERFGAHNYHPLPVNIVRARGALAWDASGREFVDCVGAYSAMAHGHLAEALVREAKAQLERATLVSRAFYTPEMALFLEALAEYSGLDMVCPMNTGAEAVETCLKLARKWAYTVKGVPEDQAEIVVCENNFHGRTTTIVGFSTEQRYRRFFGPYGPGFRTIPFGDAEALEAAIGPCTAAFLAEPIQAEAGVIVPPPGYLARVREICTRHRVLLIWDEVQTGFCRTGRRFGWSHEDARPDLMAVGKALGGGLLPVSAAVGVRGAMEVFEPGDHGSTFGGNPLACAVAVAAMAVMEAEDYAGRAERSGAFLREAFERAGGCAVREIRGRGLLLGVEFAPELSPDRLQEAFLAEGLLTKETRSRTFRFAPPIATEQPVLERIAERFEAAVRRAAGSV